ncbi:glucosyll transferase family 2 [Rhizobium freirei PRF 81]|uniref:Glucosyll transferase family 2 n=1 Tax=Rhizobium freirei PRF 81 TaxID=363754 RepID=N6TUT3_9HYPH|nr:glycosyltransferase [Rhizobium freirei]ENN84224.1 glucosyll transferase family 2 [Rhizobium freirei PRF 81]
MTGSRIETAVHPRVSVCIPAYNHEKYIGACIESVLAQTFSDFEILVTDDGSSDATVDVVKSFSDPRIRLFRLPRNQGPSVAANNNFREARGEFICPLASDDLFNREKLERQLAFLSANPQIGAAFSYMRYVNEAGEEIRDHIGYKWVEVDNCPREVWLRRFFKVGNNLSAPTAMIRRGVFDKIGLTDPRLLQTQDLDLWIRICLDFEVYVMPERLIDYRIRDNQQNTSATTPYKQAQVHWELAKVFESYATIEDRDFFCRIFPEAKESRYDNWPIKAIMADLAMKEEAHHMRAFGLELMYRVLSDEASARVLAENGFTFPSFFKAMGSADVFGIVAYSELQQRLRHTEKRVMELAEEVAFWMRRCERTLDVRARVLLRKLIGRA